jgi:hypothetical protein
VGNFSPPFLTFLSIQTCNARGAFHTDLTTDKSLWCPWLVDLNLELVPWHGVCSSVLIRAMVSAQPEPIPSPKVESGHQLESTSLRTPLRQKLKKYKQKVTTKEGWLGDYNYAWYGSIQSFFSYPLIQNKQHIQVVHTLTSVFVPQ